MVWHGMAFFFFFFFWDSLTTAFVAFNTAALSDIASPTYAQDLALARSHLFGIVNADVLYLVYIGIAMCESRSKLMGRKNSELMMCVVCVI